MQSRPEVLNPTFGVYGHWRWIVSLCWLCFELLVWVCVSDDEGRFADFVFVIGLGSGLWTDGEGGGS